MQKSRPHIVLSLLIGLSLLLLLTFQVFWLREVYVDQREVLQQEVDNRYVTTVRQLQDSLVRKVVFAFLDEAPPVMDSVDLSELPGPQVHFSTHEQVVFLQKERTAPPVDTLPQRRNIRMILSDQGERRLPGLLSTMVLTLQSADSTTILPATDSLFGQHFPGEVERRYRASLNDAGIALPFVLEKAEENDPDPEAGLQTQALPLALNDPAHYFARFTGAETFLLGQMVPQFLFSFFLLGITAFTFVQVYRNWQRQHRLTALKNDLISNITHELKTPITTVGVALEALSHFNALQNPERTREYIDISKSELSRLSLMVDKVLKTAVFERGRLELQPEPFDLKQLIEEILHAMKPHFEQLGAQVHFSCAAREVRITADRVHLANVVYNLLDNALKYSDASPAIDLQLVVKNDQVQLDVTDRGIGISPEYQDKIFDQFFRVPTGDEHNARGYGLGLSYVAGVIRQHGGTIRVASTPGQGSRFTIKMPMTYGKDQSTVR